MSKPSDNRRSMRFAAIILALAWSLLAAPVALAQSTAKAIAQSNILRETSRLAERGDAKAQYRLGFMYAKGRMVAQDFEVAAKWLHKAAEQGHADARFYLGWLYYEGKGVLQDYTFAHMWYNIAGRLKNNLLIRDTPSEEVYVLNMFRMRGSRI